VLRGRVEGGCYKKLGSIGRKVFTEGALFSTEQSRAPGRRRGPVLCVGGGVVGEWPGKRGRGVVAVDEGDVGGGGGVVGKIVGRIRRMARGVADGKCELCLNSGDG